MEILEVTGGNKLQGEVTVSGAKNVALKAILAGLLTDQEIIIHNVPRIVDFKTMVELVEHLGCKVTFEDHTVIIKGDHVNTTKVPLVLGARARASFLVLGPLLARCGTAEIPNPGGCRIGARPIDRQIKGLEQMGAHIKYRSEDGYFHATARSLKGTKYRFNKTTHTGTETLLLAGVTASGETIIENAASEPEVDDLIALLNQMGGRIKRTDPKTIVIHGVKRLHGAEFTIMPDRNEAVTFAIASLVTGGDILVHGAQEQHLSMFLEKLAVAGAGWEVVDKRSIRFFSKGPLVATEVVTRPHPYFMTDWQAPWSVLMTHAKGTSIIHETVFESRFSYVEELKKLGADIRFFNPHVPNPKEFYNFNWEDDKKEYYHAIEIKGPTLLHNGVLHIHDLRAGATLVLAALAARGQSEIEGSELVDRGYEQLDKRLTSLGAKIKRIKPI